MAGERPIARMGSRNRRIILGRLAESDALTAHERVAVASVVEDRQHVLPGWDPDFLGLLQGVRTVVDVGVLEGTPALYRAFPDAYFVLIEALPPYEDRCKNLLLERSGEYHICALGDDDGEAEIRLNLDRPAASTMLDYAVAVPDRMQAYQVPLRRLDTLLAGRSFDRDILVKIDCEGMEDRIVKGAPGFLTGVKYVIAETAIRLRHKDSYRFAALVTLMKQNGFDVFDMLRVTRAAAGQPGADIADVVFVNSALA